MSTDPVTVRQMKTFHIFKGLSKFELKHLSEVAGFDSDIYDTHAKRAAILTINLHPWQKRNKEGVEYLLKVVNGK